MRINSLYFTKEAFSSFRKNIVQSIAAITTVALCLVVVGLILLIMFVGGEVIKKIENKVEIEIFLEGAEMSAAGGADTAQYSQIDQLGRTIRGWSEVKDAKFVSKNQALEEFKRNFRNNPEVIQQIEGNPLPASYRVSLKNPRQVDKVATRIRDITYIKALVGDPKKNIKYGKDTVRKLFTLTRWLSIAAAGFAGLLIFVSLVLITNTIRLAIFARRKEIGIMRLVGASSWFIRWPFVLEGMIEGAIGALIAVLVLGGLWRTFFANLASGNVLAFLSFPFDQTVFFKLIFLLAIAGATIGALGSVIALRRFLKI